MLINLLIGVTIIIGFSIMANIANEHGDFKLQLDAQLAMSAYTIESFLDEKSNPQVLESIQDKINNIDLFKEEAGVQDNNILNLFLRSVHFQVWNQDNTLILKSYNFSKFEAAPSYLGFDQVLHDGKSWRTLTIKTKSGFTVRVMQLNSFRLMVERQLTNDSIIVLLIMYPALGVLIWIIVGKGLNPVNRVAKSVKRRRATQLSPIKIDPLPDEVKPLIEALNELFDNLNDTLAREKLFASNAAHELRTPIAALKARVQLAQKQDKEHIQENLSKIIEITDRCAHIIQQLLTLSRTLPEAIHANQDTINLNSICRDIINEQKKQITKHKIKMNLKEIDESVTIKANLAHIHILMRNIIDNAVKYSSDNSTVAIRVYKKLNQIYFEVTDQGLGLSKKQKELVFRRFYRVLGNKSTGSGLGLSIVKQITKIYRAKIELLDNEKSTGLTVRVIFNET